MGYQEIVRLQMTISNVRSTLTNLILAIDGVVIMTPNLQIALNSIFDAKPPKFWYIDPSGAQIAWTLPTLSLWFEGLLTAMKQEVTRRHKHDRWALDDVILKSTVL